MDVAVYARFSSDNQRSESIDAQLRAIEEFAKRNNHTIVKVYVDSAKSATTDKRPKFQEMIADSDGGHFQGIVVHKLDRFSRNRYDSAVYKRRLKKNNVRLMSVVENLDDSPESVMMESMLEGMAEYYSKNLAREVMKGMKETAYQCKHTGGSPPLGYDVGNDKRYIINSEESLAVKTIFEMYVTGHGYNQIIRALNEKGYKTKRGNEFGKNSIHGILTNEKYAGVYIFNRAIAEKKNYHKNKSEDEIIRIEGGMPQIISKELFEETKEMIMKRKHSPGHSNAKELYLLQGLVKCGECGSRFEGNRRKKKDKPLYVSYRCGARHRKLTCTNKEINRDYIEEYVLTELERFILNDESIELMVEKVNEFIKAKMNRENEELTQLEINLGNVDEKISNIIEAISNGFYQEEFKDKLDNLKSEKADIEVHIGRLKIDSKVPTLSKQQVKDLCMRFKVFVLNRDMQECKKIVQTFVREVVVYNDHIEVIFNVAFLIGRKDEELVIRSTITKDKIFKKWGKYGELSIVKKTAM